MMKQASKMDNKKLIPWIKKKVSANGRGFADLLYKKGREDKIGSKRVEFKLQKKATFEWILEQFGSLKPVYFRVYTKLYWCGLF